MHVLFVLETWGLIGGAERHASQVVPLLHARGHMVSVLCAQDLLPGVEGVEWVHVLPELARERLDVASRARLVGMLREIDPHVVFWTSSHNLEVFEYVVERFPVVRYVHDHALFCPSLNKYRQDGEICREPLGTVCLRTYWMEGGCSCYHRDGHAHPLADSWKQLAGTLRALELARRSAYVLTSSHYMLGELLQAGFHAERTSVLHYFTLSNTPAQPPAELDEATQAFLAASDDPLIFTSARLILPDKGIDFLLSALSRVRHPFRAVVGGTGPWQRWLEVKRAEEGLAERVLFPGWLSAGRMESLYRRAALVPFPSVWAEPFGLVGIEAMAHGLPVVAFWVGGVPEWCLPEENGFLLQRKDYQGMAAAIDRLLEDPELARRMGRRGSEILAERFPPSRHLEILEWILGKAAYE